MRAEPLKHDRADSFASTLFPCGIFAGKASTGNWQRRDENVAIFLRSH
jgi:hypothetical protein